MANMIVKHAVEDYEEWKPHFDGHAGTREQYGERGYRLFQVSEEPNEVVILFEWDTEDHAREFLVASDLRDVMEEAGVVGDPEISFLDEIETRIPEGPVA